MCASYTVRVYDGSVSARDISSPLSIAKREKVFSYSARSSLARASHCVHVCVGIHNGLLLVVLRNVQARARARARINEYIRSILFHGDGDPGRGAPQAFKQRRRFGLGRGRRRHRRARRRAT